MHPEPEPQGTTASYAQTLLLTTAAMVCFSANSVLCRLALAPGLVDAATFTSLRILSAATLLGCIVWVQKRRLPRSSCANIRSILALLAYFLFFSYAYLRLDAGSGALILIGAVQVTMLGYGFWRGERLSGLQWAGLTVALLGFVYLVLPGLNAPDPLGAVLMAISGAAWGCFSLSARGSSDPIETNAANLFGCLLPAVLLSVLTRHDLSVTGTGILIALASGGIATALGYVLWYLALRGLAATHAAVVQLSMPALVALGGVAVLSEPLTLRVLVSSALMLGGIGLLLAPTPR
jgi:drug/metabolite transporter (DMT)-like permease